MKISCIKCGVVSIDEPCQHDKNGAYCPIAPDLELRRAFKKFSPEEQDAVREIVRDYVSLVNVGVDKQ